MNEAIRDPREPFHAQARAVVKDLFEHDPWIYWTDFLVLMLLGYAAVALYLFSPTFSPPFFVGLTIAALALFRCGVFMHEIVHMPRGRMPVFQAAWNILFARSGARGRLKPMSEALLDRSSSRCATASRAPPVARDAS